jgi:hypothetical protein
MALKRMAVASKQVLRMTFSGLRTLRDEHRHPSTSSRGAAGIRSVHPAGRKSPALQEVLDEQIVHDAVGKAA